MFTFFRFCTLSKVALLTEGVDRNTWNQSCASLLHSSPSSRRAWIEICIRWGR